MAGEAVLSAFMQSLFDKLYTTGASTLRSISGVNEDLEGLSTTISMIQGLLEDAEEKQLKDKPVRIWLLKLKDIAYEMCELLDGYEAQQIRMKLKTRDQMHRQDTKITKISAYFSCLFLYRGLSDYRTANEIKAIRRKLDMIAREREILGLQVLGSTNKLEVRDHRQTSSLVDDSSVFGREKDSEKIIKILLSTNNNSNAIKFSVLPIVGMGGLGKTTLAQKVYNDNRVKEYFQLRMWVCVSESFDELKLTRETLQSAASQKLSATSWQLSTATNMNLLQEELCKSLKGKRFLLVLDDVWNENPQRWGRFCISLNSSERGSKIIVTTQNANVGYAMGALPPYHLTRLSDEDCWNLFRNCAFVNGSSSGYPKLEEIGKEIVKKLKGLPLAARALGSLLYAKTDEEDWKAILRSKIWEVPSDKNDILPALRLSYKHLTPHLKQCFAFCSVFHKDYVFQKETLVQIWMALGYIQPQGRRRLEDIGSSYFDDLLSRSFFQPYKGNYVMHDAIHDLAQSISVGEFTRLEDNTEEGQGNMGNNCLVTRHLSSFCSNSGTTSFDALLKFRKLQTLLLLRGYKSQTPRIPDNLLQRLAYLRVLDLHRRDITELPRSIGNLIQLRYLNLSGTGIKTLPPSICRLYNLQTLKLRHCHALDELPKGVTNLVNLRHLGTSKRLASTIAHIGSLIHLQELEEFNVRDDDKFTIGELKGMAELRGKLCIRNLENVRCKEESSKANMSTKEYISALHLVWTDDQAAVQHEEVLAGLKPNTNLKELAVTGYGGAKFPSWLWSPSFCYLETIHLSNCRRCLILPPLGQLPFLKYLVVEGFGATRIGHEFHGDGELKGFLSLEELVFEDMLDLELWLWAQEDQSFPRLSDLEITECPKLIELPELPPTLTRLRIFDVGLSVLPKLRHPDAADQLSLSSLQIHECPSLQSLQGGLLEQQLVALEELTITNCEQLSTLPVECFQPLAKLRSLHIYDCPRLLVSSGCCLLPGSLKDLQISSCSNLINPLLAELGRLTSLTNLKISNCCGFSCFPDNGFPPSLKSLAIVDCSDLLFLPAALHEVSSLQTLCIRDCPGITSFPENGLPRMLRELYIRGCSPLTERLLADRGSHQDKTAHVMKVVIDGQRIR